MQRISNQPNPRGGIQIPPAPTSAPQQMPTGQMNPPFQPYVVMHYPSQQQRDQQVYSQQAQYQGQPGTQQQYQQRQVFPPPQFTAQTPQGQVYQQPGTPPYYNTPSVSLQGAPTFFPGANQQGMVVAQQQIRQPFQMPQAPQYNPPKKKNIIRIVDPKSNQDITDTIIRDASRSASNQSPHSGHSSASDTPPSSQTPPQNYQVDEKKAAIQATFAAQVARLAHESPVPTPTETQFPATPEPAAVAPPQQQSLPETAVPKQPPVAVAATTDAQPGATTSPGQVVTVEPAHASPAVSAPLPPPEAKAGEPTKPPSPPSAEVSSKEASGPAAVNPTAATESHTAAATANSAPPAQTQPVPPPQSTDAVDSRTDMPPPSIVPPQRGELSQEPRDSLKGAPKAEAKPAQEAAEQAESDAQKPAEASQPVTSQPKSEESLAGKVEEVVTAKPASREESAVPAKREESKEAATKEPSKKKSQKNRFRDIEKKAPKDEDEFEAYRSTEQVEESLESEKEVQPAPKEVENATPETTPETKPRTTPETTPESTPETSPATTQDVAHKPEAEPEKVASEEGPTKGAESVEEAKEAEPKEVVASVVVDGERKPEPEPAESEDPKSKEGTEDTERKESLKDNKIQLKYTYREDQWSPMNPEGKKQYNRDFLLQFQQDCKEKPEGLPHIPDIVLDKAEIRPPSFDPPGKIPRADFTPSYLKSPRGMPQPPFGQGMPAGGRRSSKEPKKVIQRVSQPIKLNTAGENAWKPDKDMPADEEEAKTKELFKKIKSLLNKLTPNNYEKLKTQAIGYNIDTEERLKGVIDLVFEKAISESSFSKTYAQLCRDLSQLKVPAASGNGMVQFRTLLINRCQKEFEKEKSDEQEEKLEREKIAQLPADQRSAALENLEIKLIKNKQRMLGNIRFIGELFKLQMLIEQIMHDCIFKLLCNKDDESLECMSHLMSTIGKILDHEKAKNRMDQYFNQIKNLTANKKTSARIRFMLQDITDLRARNWVPRRANDNPKTIEQIREDFKREEERKKMEGIAQMQANQPPRLSRNKRDQPQRVGPPPPEGWNTVASTKAARVSVDPNKFRVTKQQSIDDDIQLGPGRQTFGGWSRGSSGGSSKAQPNQEQPEPRQSNRFMMLSEEKRGRGPSAVEARGRGPQGLGSKRSSSSREREQNNRERQSAIAEVQRISGGRRSNSREDREADIRRVKPEPAPVPALAREPVKPTAAATASPELSEEVFEKKAVGTIEEYLNIRDIGEAIECVNDLQSPNLMHVFVRSAMNCSLEKSPQARDLVGLLFFKLLKAGHLSKEKFVDGVKEVLMYADDMALDIPLIWKYLGEIIGSTFRDNSLSLTLLADMMDPVRIVDKAGDLMAEILLMVVKLNGANVVAEMWQSSGFKWDMFVPIGKDVKEFVNNKKLDFTLTAVSSSTTNSGGDANANNVVTDEEWVRLIRRELGCILTSAENVNNSVFDWIQKHLNIGASQERQRLFIRALVTVVVRSTIQGEAESCRMNHDLLTTRMSILKRYINNDNFLELQALYAVQALNQSLENPPRLLGHVFNVLYDEDVIPEETFYAWQKSTDPNEALGKGVALKSVTSFFDWLRDADEEPR
ncbi:eukaryotic translation initiation factor 4 gamma 3-like isoform X7 [Acanthaster planci]|nr:eukaryotic translation initiation factor 4 gamma 3-like isoform X7 [Acanthaster planci]